MATCIRARCQNPALPKKSFCSTLCRNVHVSNLMVKKAVEIKRVHGNSYYVKGLKQDVSQKD